MFNPFLPVLIAVVDGCFVSDFWLGKRCPAISRGPQDANHGEEGFEAAERGELGGTGESFGVPFRAWNCKTLLPKRKGCLVGGELSILSSPCLNVIVDNQCIFNLWTSCFAASRSNFGFWLFHLPQWSPRQAITSSPWWDELACGEGPLLWNSLCSIVNYSQKLA